MIPWPSIRVDAMMLFYRFWCLCFCLVCFLPWRSGTVGQIGPWLCLLYVLLRVSLWLTMVWLCSVSHSLGGVSTRRFRFWRGSLLHFRVGFGRNCNTRSFSVTPMPIFSPFAALGLWFNRSHHSHSIVWYLPSLYISKGTAGKPPNLYTYKVYNLHRLVYREIMQQS